MDGLLSEISHPWILILAFIISTPIFWQCWKSFFGDLQSLRDDVTDAIPNFITDAWGFIWQADWAALKILGFLLVCIIEVAAIYKLILVLWY
jgi:hypothetical protein